MICITKDQLQAALLHWEQQARAGETRTAEETLALPAEQVAAENADFLWDELAGATTTEGSP